MMKILFVLLALALILSVTGCGIKEKLGQMAGEAIVENILKDAGLDVDVNGDNLVIKGEDGEELKIGGSEWPRKSALAKYIPELKVGTIVSSMQSDEAIYLLIEEVPQKDFNDYLEQIKETFNVDSYEASTEGTTSYSAKNGEGCGVLLIYSLEGELNITVSKTES